MVLAKTAAMRGISVSYKKTASNYKGTMMRRYICYSVVLFLAIAAIVGVIILIVK